MPVEWKNTDPRHDLVGRKWASIIILRPHPQGGPRWDAGTGHVEMKHGWHISTSFEERRMISDESWDPAWRWTLAPDVT